MFFLSQRKQSFLRGKTTVFCFFFFSESLKLEPSYFYLIIWITLKTCPYTMPPDIKRIPTKKFLIKNGKKLTNLEYPSFYLICHKREATNLHI